LCIVQDSFHIESTIKLAQKRLIKLIVEAKPNLTPAMGEALLFDAEAEMTDGLYSVRML